MRLPVAALVVLATSGCIVDGRYLVRGTVRSADPARSPVAGARVSIEECVPPGERMGHMRINITSVLVDDQKKALRFYTEVLGFQKKQEVPLGDDWWLTVVSPGAPDGTELLLEPDRHPAARPFKQALVKDGIPFTSFAVDDVYAEYARLKALGVRFTQPPLDAGPVVIAVFDDTCGNLIQIVAKKDP